MNEETRINRIAEWIPYILVGIAAFVFLLPFIVYSLAKCFGLDSGVLGDTIGGSTAPVVGFVSAILVFLSFRAQIDANNRAREEVNFRYAIEQIQLMKTKVDEAKQGILYNLDEDGFKVASFSRNLPVNWEKQNWDSFNAKYIKKVHFLLTHLDTLFEQLDSLKFSEEFEEIVYDKLWLLYDEDIREEFDAILEWDALPPEGYASHALAFELHSYVGLLKPEFDSLEQ